MKKTKILFVFIFILLILFCTSVNAECSNDDLKVLKVEASNLKIQYELKKKVDASDGMEYYYYSVKVLNMTKNLVIPTFLYQYSYNDVGEDGSLVIANEFTPGSREKFEIYASDDSVCANEKITSKTVSFPYYNKYSEREECEDLKDFAICKSNSNTSNVDEESFLKEIEKAKEEKENKKIQNEPDKEEKSFLEKVIDFYWNNRNFSIPITIFVILLIVVVGFIIIKNENEKKKKKIRIDIKEKK